jgi:hypothetical protein
VGAAGTNTVFHAAGARAHCPLVAVASVQVCVVVFNHDVAWVDAAVQPSAADVACIVLVRDVDAAQEQLHGPWARRRLFVLTSHYPSQLDLSIPVASGGEGRSQAVWRVVELSASAIKRVHAVTEVIQAAFAFPRHFSCSVAQYINQFGWNF